MGKSDLSEEEIHAYVDGRLSAEQKAKVEEILKTNIEARKTVEVFIEQKRLLRLLYRSKQRPRPRTGKRKN